MGSSWCRAALLSFALLGAAQAHAQYKCTVNGKATYSDLPCAANARPIGELQDRVSQDQQLQAQQQRLNNQRQLGNIEAADEAYRRAHARQVASLQAAEAAEAAAKQRRCSSISYDIQNNQRGVARYQDFGWQRSLSQQEAELKRNRELFDRECR